MKHVSELVTTINGYVNVFFNCGDHASLQAILGLGTRLLLGLRDADKPNYFDKICAALLAALAGSQFLSGQRDEARATLIKAKELAAFFDASPSYDESDIRFVIRLEGASAHDDLGPTAMDGVLSAVSQFKNEAFTALWREVSEDGSK